MPESAAPKIGVVAGLRADDCSGPPVPRQKWPGGLPISFRSDLGPNWSSISFRVRDAGLLCQAVFANELQLGSGTVRRGRTERARNRGSAARKCGGLGGEPSALEHRFCEVEAALDVGQAAV